MKKISAIIACYNDGQAIPIMHKRLTDLFTRIHVNYEIIFINDGSIDNSEEILKNLVKKDRHVVNVNHTRSFSSQIAFTSGMDIATGDAIVLLDGDLQDPPEIIADFYKKWIEGYDIVYGVRVKRKTSILLQLSYKLFYRIFHMISYINIPLDAGDFSLIDRKVVEVLKTFPERDRFIRGLRAWVGFKQAGVSYIRPERMFGSSTNNLIKNFYWAIKGIVSFSYIPLQVITLISLLTFALSVAALFIQLFLRILFPNLAPRGITTVLLVILFLGSVQLLSISILGEYIAKIFEEVKQRPKYVIKSIIRRK